MGLFLDVAGAWIVIFMFIMALGGKEKSERAVYSASMVAMFAILAIRFHFS